VLAYNVPIYSTWSTYTFALAQNVKRNAVLYYNIDIYKYRYRSTSVLFFVHTKGESMFLLIMVVIISWCAVPRKCCSQSRGNRLFKTKLEKWMSLQEAANWNNISVSGGFTEWKSNKQCSWLGSYRLWYCVMMYRYVSSKSDSSKFEKHIMTKSTIRINWRLLLTVVIDSSSKSIPVQLCHYR